MSRYDTDFNKMGFGTRAVRSGEHPDERTHALNTPIFESSTFAYETAEEYDEMLERGAGWEEGLYIYLSLIHI